MLGVWSIHVTPATGFTIVLNAGTKQLYRMKRDRKQYMKEYNSSDAGRRAQSKYNDSQKGKETRSAYYRKLKLHVLLYRLMHAGMVIGLLALITWLIN